MLGRGGQKLGTDQAAGRPLTSFALPRTARTTITPYIDPQRFVRNQSAARVAQWIERRTPTYTYGDIRRPSVRPRPRVLCRIDITVRSYAQYLSGPIFDEESDSQLHFGSFCHPGAVFRRVHLTFIHTVCAIGNRIAQPSKTTYVSAHPLAVYQRLHRL